MILPANTISSSSIALLFGTSNTLTSTTAAGAPRQGPFGETAGYDSVLNTGNAIGTIIEIAARMSGDAANSGATDALGIFGANGTYARKEFDDDSVTETFVGTSSQISSLHLYDADGTYLKQQDAKGNTVETFTGTASGHNGDNWQQFWIDQTEAALNSGTVDQQFVAESQDFLAALKAGTVEHYDASTMGVTSTMTAYRSASGQGATVKTDGLDAFVQNYTETKDGVMYDKATGKHASLGGSGSQVEYFVW